MSKPIEVGDLVVLVHVHCARQEAALGMISTVQRINPAELLGCGACGAYLPSEAWAIVSPTSATAPLSWLKRIPPLGELIAKRKSEKVPA